MPNENLKTLEDKLSYAYDTKVAIKDAIEAKGVEVPEGTVFRDYATKIGEIQSGGGTFSVTDSGNATGFPRTAIAGEIVEFSSGERYSIYSVTGEDGSDIPVGIRMARGAVSIYYFVMPSQNVTTTF